MIFAAGVLLGQCLALHSIQTLAAEINQYNQPSVSLINTWNRSYRIGENFTLPCHVHLATPRRRGHGAFEKQNKRLKNIWNQYKNSIQFVRLVDDEDTIVSTGERLSKAAAKTERYTVIIRRVDNFTIIASLHIRGLTHSDGGRLGCKVGGQDYGLTAYTGSEIIVNVPISDVHLGTLTPNSTYLKLKNNAALHMTNSYRPVKSGFYCQVMVRGGSIRPKVMVLIGKKDITKYCKRDVARSWIGANKTMERGYLVRYEFETWHPSWMMDGSRLQCKAKVPNYPIMVSSSVLNITYSPTILCREKSYALRGTRKAVVKCRGRMNPPPSYAVWWWTDGLKEVIIPYGISKYGYTADLKVLGRGLYEFLLIIDFVSLSVFRWYTLEIDNGMGLRRKAIQFVEGVDPDGTGSMHNQGDFTLMCLSVVTGYMTHGYGLT